MVVRNRLQYKYFLHLTRTSLFHCLPPFFKLYADGVNAITKVEGEFVMASALDPLYRSLTLELVAEQASERQRRRPR